LLKQKRTKILPHFEMPLFWWKCHLETLKHAIYKKDFINVGQNSRTQQNWSGEGAIYLFFKIAAGKFRKVGKKP
jgi:hypothetical protein